MTRTESGTVFKQGEVWFVPFPYSDFTTLEKRPVLVISNNNFNNNNKDILVCQITTKIRSEYYSISLKQKDLETGNLPEISEIRCNKINILEKTRFIKRFSKINDSKFNECTEKIKHLVSKPQT